MNPDDLRALMKLIDQMFIKGKLTNDFRHRLLDLIRFELRLLEKRG